MPAAVCPWILVAVTCKGAHTYSRDTYEKGIQGKCVVRICFRHFFTLLHPGKVKVVKIDQRMTFQDAFQYSNDVLHGQVCHCNAVHAGNRRLDRSAWQKGPLLVCSISPEDEFYSVLSEVRGKFEPVEVFPLEILEPCQVGAGRPTH